MLAEKGKRIRVLRKTADLTQWELSGLAGIERTRLCLAERGHVRLRPEELVAVEHAVVAALRRKATAFSRLAVKLAQGSAV